MAILLQLPSELLSDILTYALDIHRTPGDILCVHSHVNATGKHVLYSRLRFTSVRQLELFSQTQSSLPCSPRTLHLALPGGGASLDVFRSLRRALQRCLQSLKPAPDAEHISKLPLELLSLRLNSHTMDPHLQEIYDALVLASPREFIWFGPDPGHHFSTAIVPPATSHLFRAISTWKDVEHITITNIAFPTGTSLLCEPLDPAAPLLPTMPALRTLHIGQATFLPPTVIAAMVCLVPQPCLELVRLVDAYGESIWGRRIRRSDIEKAITLLGLDTVAAALKRIRRIVRCEAQNERIIGGDRAEGRVFLE